jgi:predicted kinase
MAAKINPNEAIELLVEYGNYERHFNQLQGVYRGLASTWFLACYAGIGFLYSSNLKAFPIPINLAASLTLLAVATIIILFWLLDVMVYHKLLLSVLKASEKVEKEANLIELREFMKQSTFKFNVRRAVSIYYLLPIGVLVVSSIFFLLSPIALEGQSVAKLKCWHILVFSIWIAILVCIGILIFIFQKRKNTTQKIILIRGMIGSGKTTVSRLISEQLKIPILRTDSIRKELMEKPSYSEEDKHNVYSKMFQMASEILQDGRSIIMEGTFGKKDYIDSIIKLSNIYGVKLIPLLVQVNDDSIIESRLKLRKGDDSEANFTNYLEQRSNFESSDFPFIIINNTARINVLKRKIDELIRSQVV